MKFNVGKFLFPKLARDQRRRRVKIICLTLGVGLAVSLIFLAAAFVKSSPFAR